MVAPGVHALTAVEYLADPCPAPSLSASLAHVLLDQSPRHAWTASARLNPDFKAEESEAFDLGKAAHAYLLEGSSTFTIIKAPDWRTKEARQARDDARALGLTPILAHRWAAVQAMAHAAREQLQHVEPPMPFADGRPEVTLLWQDSGIWLRARLDWLHSSGAICDYKTTEASAHPAAWSRTLFNNGADLQAALYLRGVKRLLGITAEFRFVVQENYPSFALSVISLDPEALAFADQKIARAISLWRECLASNHWPGYPTRTAYAEVPAYLKAQFMEAEYYR